MLEVPSKIFNRKLDEVEIGVSTISLFSKDELDEAQKGYRVDAKNNENKEWIGKEFVVIGNDSCCGAPIIAKVDEEQIPVFSMFHDDWKSLGKVAESFEQYVDVLGMIKETDLYRSDKIAALKNKIKNVVPEESMYYWEDLISAAFDYLAYDYGE